MWIPNAFYPSFVALILNVVFIIYIIRMGLSKPGNFPAFLLFLTVAVGVTGEVLERIAGPPPEDAGMAYLGSELIALSGVFLPAVFVHFGMDFPYRLRVGTLIRRVVLGFLYGFSFMGVLFLLLNDKLGGIMVWKVSPYSAIGQEIWGMDYGALYYFYLLASFVCGFALLAVLYIKLRKTKIKILKNQIKMVLAGLIIVYILITFSVMVPALLRYEFYPLSSIALTVFGIFVIYTIARYNLFVVSPVQETGKKAELKHRFEAGTVRVLPTDEAYSLFSEQVHGGIPGLLFTVEDTERVRNTYGLKKTPVFRISETPGKDTLNPQVPEHREMIPFIISEFLEQSSSGVVFLDRIDAKWDSLFVEFIGIIIDFVREEHLGVLLITPSTESAKKALEGIGGRGNNA
ncbi:MAG: hypothetical protein GXO25_02440 [Euryarchaeota archaeon]|nr:hypothetical protein [Euryarchaeota archaeon]